MFCLSLFDVTGIQDFIFSSKKAQENVGASVLVSQVFDKFLVDAIKKTVSAEAVLTSWKDAKTFRLPNEAALKAEIVYIGGGNAVVAFRDKSIAIVAMQEFSKSLLEKTGGALGVAVAHIDVESASSFNDDMDRLRSALDKKKFTLKNSSPMLGIAVTHEGATDGLPAVCRGKDGQWISRPAANKRASAEAGYDSFTRYLPSGDSDSFRFPKEFDRLGRDKTAGESFIAVVHVDGNSMGKAIKDYIGSTQDYAEAIGKMREISKKISEVYESSFKELVKDFSVAFTALANQWFNDIFDLKLDEDSGKPSLPLRPLIFAGDDVTFVCDGRIAIDLVVSFMNKLYKHELSKGRNFTACAGIALVKPHFPFFRAYNLAEELCGVAKKKSKSNNKRQPGSWFDFQIVFSGLPTDLDAYRSSKYSVPGLGTPEVGLYNLLWRPYSVVGVAKDSDDDHSWDSALANLESLNGDDGSGRGWPRSKLKGLREALCASIEEARLFCEECKSRGNVLPDRKSDPFAEKPLQTRWYDSLELLDSYVRIPWCEEGGNSDEN